MAVRNFNEMGENLMLIVDRLLNNQKLCKLLKYTDSNPLLHPDFEDTRTLLHKRIRVVPKIEAQENTESTIVIMTTSGYLNGANHEFNNIEIEVYIYVPFEEWIINDVQLRPFAIMSEVQNSLNEKQIKGLGKMMLDNFGADMITDEMGAYRMHFSLSTFA